MPLKTVSADDILQAIWIERSNCFMKNKGEYPCNVLIHTIHRKIINDSVNQFLGSFQFDEKSIKIMDMKLIYTDSIEENEVICTYEGTKII